ncbi:MAG: response regulator [Fibrobacterota bacterium]|nr:response regulator [Fibrobacterota bacterium]
MESKGNILIVDDEPAICTVICDYLRLQGYNCASANAVDSALQILQTVQGVDCILSDIKMPGKSGIDLLRKVTTNWPDTAVILFTGNAEIQTAVASMQEGAYDFILKPIQLKQVIHSITNALEKKRMKLELQNYQRNLEMLVTERTNQIKEAMQMLEGSHLDTINRLCHAAEYRDDETGYHVLRISKYCEVLARGVGMTEEETWLLSKASPLHDIGKIGIPDSILLKPGRLTADEFEIMKKHAEIGGQILKNANSRVLQVAETVAISHHEKWDGSGYPRGLKGEEIPLMGRITAVADVFDALTMKRCYKPPFSMEQSAGIITEGRGKHFDPLMVDIFLSRLNEFVAIHGEYSEK